MNSKCFERSHPCVGGHIAISLFTKQSWVRLLAFIRNSEGMTVLIRLISLIVTNGPVKKSVQSPDNAIQIHLALDSGKLVLQRGTQVTKISNFGRWNEIVLSEVGKAA